jgi:hypothetical protein
MCHPLLSVKEILKRVTKIYEGREDAISFEVAREIIQLAGNRCLDRSFLYLEVEEEHNPRLSFDLNLYKASLRLVEIHASLLRICRHYSISSEQFNRLYQVVGQKLFGHLSGGLNPDGKDFLTVYYEV